MHKQGASHIHIYVSEYVGEYCKSGRKCIPSIWLASDLYSPQAIGCFTVHGRKGSTTT